MTAPAAPPPRLPPLAMVVAVARGGVLGKDGGLPWHVPEDLKHFRRVTTGHAIVMGRATWASIGRVLPERRMIVVSRTLASGALPEGVLLARDLDAALALARETDAEPRIVGGAQIYAAALPRVTRLFLTEIDRDVAGDTVLPPFDRAAFREVSRRVGETPDVTFLELLRAGVESEPPAGQSPGR